MKYILIPDAGSIRQLPFYFAIEEYVARRYNDDDYFMGWRVNPTVMLGRNQLIENEVNTDYCHEQNIDIFRRKERRWMYLCRHRMYPVFLHFPHL